MEANMDFDDDAPRLSIAPVEQNGESRLRFFLKALGCTTVLYICLSAVFYVFPRVGLSVLGSAPWVGRFVLEDHRLHRRLALEGLTATFETLKDNKRVLVISGVATNKNPFGLGEIVIEGKIYDAQGKQLSHVVVSGGNALSRKILRDLTAKDISLLQVQKARKRFEIPARESTEFVIVFLSPKRGAAQFSARVVSARAVP